MAQLNPLRSSSQPKSLRILIFGHPRTACHLLFKMLTGKPETDGLVFLDAYTSGVDRQNSYPPGAVIATPRRPVDGIVSYQTCLDEVQRVVTEDEKKASRLPYAPFSRVNY